MNCKLAAAGVTADEFTHLVQRLLDKLTQSGQAVGTPAYKTAPQRPSDSGYGTYQRSNGLQATAASMQQCFKVRIGGFGLGYFPDSPMAETSRFEGGARRDDLELVQFNHAASVFWLSLPF